VAAPGIAVAQAIGRWGNWFNQELYGRPTDLPWALKIDLDKRVAGYENYATFHPTFLYESLWALALAGILVWAERRYRLGHGRVFALYVAGYTVGRFWIEYLRIDTAHRFGGLRLNDWVSLGVFMLAVTYIVISSRVRPGREDLRALAPAGAGEPDVAGQESGVPRNTTSGDSSDPERRDRDDAIRDSAYRDGADPNADRDSADRDSADQDGAGRESAGRESAGRESADRNSADRGGEAKGRIPVRRGGEAEHLERSPDEAG
jgi:hypothetical protein